MSRANIVVRNIIFTHGEEKARNINYGLVINCIHQKKQQYSRKWRFTFSWNKSRANCDLMCKTLTVVSGTLSTHWTKEQVNLRATFNNSMGRHWAVGVKADGVSSSRRGGRSWRRRRKMKCLATGQFCCSLVFQFYFWHRGSIFNTRSTCMWWMWDIWLQSDHKNALWCQTWRGIPDLCPTVHGSTRWFRRSLNEYFEIMFGFKLNSTNF